ncbi:MAG: class I SAM-dependent methyltransferase [Gammaproteobacteria bacterium]|nr:class I SAM-dependent methyltransferase [Gammaproteobacteria bacterium]
MSSDSGAADGYVRDNAYNSSFNASQAPILLSYVAATAGFAPPEPERPFRYVELGCGSGVTLNGLAAACPQGSFVGVDFNAQNIAMARGAALAAGLGNVRYIDAPFSALDGSALAPADYIACVGTYSWLDAAEKAALIRLAGASLKSGGIFNLGFVTLGRAAVTPMWQVLRGLVPAGGAGSLERLKAGIGLLTTLRDHGAKYLQQNPQALALLNDVHQEEVSGDIQGLTNLSHNLLAGSYRVELLDEVAAALACVGLEFAGSAAPFSNDPDLCVPAALRECHDALPNRVSQELFKDFLGATVARFDVFIKGAQPDTTASHRYLIDRSRAALVGDRSETWRQLESPGWTSFDLATPATRYVFERIADGIGGIAALVQGAPHSAEDICDAYFKLLASPGFDLSFDAPGAASSQLPSRVSPSSGYNRLALKAALDRGVGIIVAAPGLGGCVPVTSPGSMLLAEFCAGGTVVSDEEMHARLSARVAAIPGLDPSLVRQVQDRDSFAALHRQIGGRVLPMLLRFGAMRPD